MAVLGRHLQSHKVDGCAGLAATRESRRSSITLNPSREEGNCFPSDLGAEKMIKKKDPLMDLGIRPPLDKQKENMLVR